MTHRHGAQLRSIDVERRRRRRWRRLRHSAWATVSLMFLAAATLAVCWALFPFPGERLDAWPASPQVLDVRGRPLMSVVSADDQWCLPVGLDRMSPWLARATVAVEDQRFRGHPGVDPLAVVRAAAVDVRAMRIVSGASTLDMQICRMMYDRPRTLDAKVLESFRALQLNRIRTKDEILELYLNVAPYGGNLRGVEAASLAFFGKHASELSLAEASLIAGLPQNPAGLRPDRHLDAALARRRVVLRRMVEEGFITPEERADAEGDPIVIRAAKRPVRSPHAAFLALARRPGGGQTTIDLDLQTELDRLADEHLRRLPAGSELAAVIIDVERSAIVAMIGSGDPSDPEDGQVNGVLARRSPGSALKPFIYAAAFESGRLNPDATVYDVPIRRGGWAPENFDRSFSGEVTAGDALRRSLNVPAILVAEGVGLARCCGTLEAAGVHLPADAASRGGLGLVVGGIEVTLLDLTNAYATVAREGIRATPRLFVDEPVETAPALDANVCATLDDVLSSHRRRPARMQDLAPDDVPWFMWKTGTSSGRRDAWAVGHNGRYAIGVWVGRFRGTGRLSYVGSVSAEPLLAQLFSAPVFRATDPVREARPILVRRPLPVPREVARALRIVAPSPGDTFLATETSAVVHARANRNAVLQWFVNGRLVDASDGRFTLVPGSYELRCVAPDGQSSSVRFEVASAATASSR